MQFEKVTVEIFLGAKRNARQQKSECDTCHQHFHTPSTPVCDATAGILHEMGNCASDDG
jgi:hypothetical protein